MNWLDRYCGLCKSKLAFHESLNPLDMACFMCVNEDCLQYHIPLQVGFDPAREEQDDDLDIGPAEKS